VRFGRPLKLTPHQRREARKRYAGGETLVEDWPLLQRQSHDDRALARSWKGVASMTNAV
jgi:hypothetical protein